MNDNAIGRKLEQITQLISKEAEKTESLKRLLNREESEAQPLEGKTKSEWLPSDYIQLTSVILLFCALIVSIGTFWWSVKSNQRQFKAFLYVKMIGIGGGAGGGQYITTIQIENSGDTPARRVRVTNAGLYIIPGNVGFDLDSLQPNQPGVTFGLLPPKLTATVSMDMTPDQVELIRRSIDREIVMGQIEYVDVFGKAHKTLFCERAVGNLVKTDKEPETFLFGDCVSHNCDDDDCPVSK